MYLVYGRWVSCCSVSSNGEWPPDIDQRKYTEVVAEDYSASQAVRVVELIWGLAKHFANQKYV